jgi:PAS domain S-box-containing protein
MKEDDKIQQLRKERAYLSTKLEEVAKELARLDLLNLTLVQQKRQAVAAFHFIRIIQGKIEKALTIDDLYLNVVKALTSDLLLNSAALLQVNYKTRDISTLASAGLPENLKRFKISRNISKQRLLEPTFANSKSSLQVFHKFVIKSFKFPYFVWHPVADEENSTLVLFVGNRFEDLVLKQPFSEASLEIFGAISSVILLRRENIVRTQEMIRKKEEKIDFLAEILKTSPLSVITMDEDTIITYCNPAAEKLYGYKMEELIGKGIGMLNAEPNAGEIEREILDTVRQGEVWRGELLNRKKNGDMSYIYTSIYQLLDREGNFIALVGFQEDITARKQAEKALMESEKKYRDLVNNALVGIYTTNLKGDILYVNEALWRMLEFESPEEMVGESALTRYKNPKDREVILENLGERGRIEDFDTTLLTKTGKTKDILLSATLDGDIISGMIMDITERKQAEEALKLYREIFYHSNDGIGIINPEGFYLEQNPAHIKLIGYSAEELKGKTPAIHLGNETFLKIIEEQTKKGVYRGEIISHGKLGEKKDIDLSAFTITNKNGEVICYVGIKRDITERKRVQEQLQNLSRRLIEVQEAERRFLASELHDQVGQNLTALSINLNIIRSQFSEEVDKKIVDRLKDSLKLVEETIERMRNVMAGLRPPVLDDYGLGVALRWYTERFSERTGVATILQEEELFPRLPLVVETALFRIVQEILTNVAKHAKAREVLIKLEKVDGKIQLAISDNGVGFDPAALRQLKEQPGLGLITIEERAKALAGDVYVKSALGKGTQVVVQLPC